MKYLKEARGRRSAWQKLAPTVFVIFSCFFFSVYINAHTLGQSYVFVDIEETRITGHLELPIDTLEIAIQAQNPEFKLENALVNDSQWKIIEPYIRSHFRISQNNIDYKLELLERNTLNIEIANYLLVNFIATAPASIPEKIQFHYSALLHAFASHRGGLVIVSNYKTGLDGDDERLSYLFAPGREDFVFNTLGDSWLSQLSRFIVEGATHIWLGFDHVLFIVTLLLMSVVTQVGRRYQAVGELRPALINVFKLVTLFTIAHSITLFLGLKGWVDLPPHLVEPIIALSIVVVAINNIFPLQTKQVGAIIFAFGLFHGLGFASVLLDLAINREAKILSLLGFNIGVELGQLAIVVCIFPILFMIRFQSWYNFLVLRAGSACIAMVGAWWFVSRVFFVDL